MTRFAATDTCCLARARRELRDALRRDAGLLAGYYVSAEWVGHDEIADAARSIREQRARMTQSTGFDQLEYALSECAAMGRAGHGPPVLVLGVQALTAEPGSTP